MRSLTLSQWSDLTTGDNYVIRLRSSTDSASESILDELEAIDLGLVKIVVERVTVVKFRMDYGTGPNLVQKYRSTSFPSSPSLPSHALPSLSPLLSTLSWRFGDGAPILSVGGPGALSPEPPTEFF
jgi:hypothetical protein